MAVKPTTSPVMKGALFENEINPGPQGYFDPLGLAHWVLIANGVTLPGMLSNSQNVAFADVGNGWAGSFDVPFAGFLQIFAFIGFLELNVMKDSANGAAPGAFPGDFRNGYIDFGWDTFTPEEQDEKRGIELNNGRAAMMGLLGLCAHEQVGASPWIGIEGSLPQL